MMMMMINGSVKEQKIDERIFVHVWCMMHAKWKHLGINMCVGKENSRRWSLIPYKLLFVCLIQMKRFWVCDDVVVGWFWKGPKDWWRFGDITRGKHKWKMENIGHWRKEVVEWLKKMMSVRNPNEGSDILEKSVEGHVIGWCLCERLSIKDTKDMEHVLGYGFYQSNFVYSQTKESCSEIISHRRQRPYICTIFKK